MVPASATRTVVPSSARGAELAWRPANVPFSVGAELRALVVWGALVGGLSVFLLLGYVWMRLKVVEAGYRLSATRQLVERLELEGRELMVRAAASDATGRLEELAATRLGMRSPGAGEEEILP
jgi:hypothetical protein